MAREITIKLYDGNKLVLLLDGQPQSHDFEKLEAYDENGDLMFVRPFDREKFFRELHTQAERS